MEQFVGLEIWFTASIPVFLLLGAVFYMGYRKSCRLLPLILSQVFIFFTLMISVTVLFLYNVIPDVAMPIVYLLLILFFYVGGASLTGKLMAAHAREEYEQRDAGKGGE